MYGGKASNELLRGFNWSLLGRRIIIILMISLTIFTNPFVVLVAHADPTSAPSEKAEGVFGEGTGGQSQPEPDSKTGAMTWTYPFSLPAARGRPQPKLALSYNSSSHDREAGYGWGLDLPVIERKPLSGNPCFTQDGNPIACGEQRKDVSGDFGERYTYNGQPLVFICKLTGSQGQGGKVPGCGDEPQPNWSSDPNWSPNSGWRYFRLQVEGQFSRFYLSGDRRYWWVQLKGGELLEFGEPPNSSTLGVEHAFGNENAILRWRLVRHSDAVHKVAGQPVNHIDYRWKRIGKRGLLYLTDIYDTPRANSPSNDVDFAHHTQLTWQSPDFLQTFYADPYRATPDLRLSRVAVASMPWSGTGSREVTRTYRLEYKPAQGAISTEALSQVFQLWHHSFLSEILLEGRCETPLFEDDNGNIPDESNNAADQSCPSKSRRDTLPPTRFEYEDGVPEFGIASISKVKGGPPNTVDDNRVLPYLNSVAVIDFDRDGLPDVVQGWDAQFCPGEGEHEDAIHESIRVSPNQDYLQCEYKTPDGLEPRNFQSTRPITGYLNRGLEGITLDLSYQCMDAGAISNITGVTHYNAGRAPSFLTNKGGTTLVGSWGDGVLAWSDTQWAPYRARSLLSAYNPDEFDAGMGCDPDHFKEADFDPQWRWEKTQKIDWAKPLLSDPDPSNPGRFVSHPPRWFTDVDGDGLVDRLADTGIRAFDFNVADVEFTRRYAKNEPRPAPGSGSAQIPFAFDPSTFTGESLAPSAEARSDTKFYYVDINGDGLVDLVTQNPNDSGGIPQVRPGDGHGHFLCENSQQPWVCQEWSTEPSPAYEIAGIGSRLP